MQATGLGLPGEEMSAMLDRLGSTLGNQDSSQNAIRAMAELANGIDGLVKHIRAEQADLRIHIDEQGDTNKKLRELIEAMLREDQNGTGNRPELMASLSRSRRSEVTNYWPGFVDALSSLLLVIIFLLSLFMLTQFFLGQEIQGKDTAMTKLNSQIAELTDMLQLERSNNTDLNGNLRRLPRRWRRPRPSATSCRRRSTGIGGATDAKDSQIAGLTTDLDEAERHLGRRGRRRWRCSTSSLPRCARRSARCEHALDASETKATESKTQIADLGRRLNLALAQRVQDLSRYRSDFFGRLRQDPRGPRRHPGGRRSLRVPVRGAVPAGHATVSDAGKPALDKLADAIKRAADRDPAAISTGCCASTATPTSGRSTRRSSRRTGSCARRAPSRC